MPNPSARAPRLPSWVWAFGPVLLAAWLRLRNIGVPEPFVDEGANILTALDPRVRAIFAPLEQGRPWIVHLFLPAGWIPAHALEVARGMTAGAGLVTVTALGWTLHRLGGRVAAICGMLVWAALPFAVFHERLALEDPFVAALLALALALVTGGTLAGPGRRTWPWFLGAGMLAGGAFLLKISALFAVPWLGLFYAAVRRRAGRRIFDQNLAAVAAGFLLPVATLGSNLLRLGSGLGNYDALPKVAAHGFLGDAAGRVATWLGWYVGYGRWPLVLVAGTALVVWGLRRDRLALACLVGWTLTLPIAGLFYHNTYARYVLPDHLPLVMFVALAVGGVWSAGASHWKWAGLVPVITCAAWAGGDWQLGNSPAGSPFPAREIEQYFTGPWSGRGVGQAVDFLDDFSERHAVSCLVVTHRFHRPGCYGLMLAELGDPRIGVIPFVVYDPADLAAVRSGLVHTTSGRPVAYFLLYEGSLYPPHPWLDQPGAPTHLALVIDRGGGETFRLYQFTP